MKTKQTVSKQESIDLRFNEKILKVSVRALRNLSLNSSSHKAIFKNDNLPILIPYIKRIENLIKQIKDSENVGSLLTFNS